MPADESEQIEHLALLVGQERAVAAGQSVEQRSPGIRWLDGRREHDKPRKDDRGRIRVGEALFVKDGADQACRVVLKPFVGVRSPVRPLRRALSESRIVGFVGLENLGGRLGLRGHGSMPLETLLELKPDILIRDDQQPEMPALAYEVLRHPALKALIDRSLQVVVPRRLWICGIPAVVEAVAILSEARRQFAGRARS